MTDESNAGAAVYRCLDIRAIEESVARRSGPIRLMEIAGLAAARIARDMASESDSGRGVLVFAGPGNNGGDAFVVARVLKSWWFKVCVVFAGVTDQLPDDARAAYRSWLEAGGAVQPEAPRGQAFDLIVDGLFGIGLKRRLDGRYAQLVTAINESPAPVLALDIPSGLDADTGRVLGCAVRAERTATFIGLKPGLLTGEGPDHCGRIEVCPLGLDANALATPPGAVIGPNVLREVLPARHAASHKGTYGSVAVIGGARGMTGAALLAARAALHVGAGRVYVGLLDGHSAGVDPAQPELMLREVDRIFRVDHLSALAVGPGLGTSADAQSTLHWALAGKLPLVLDADALNLVAADASLRQALRDRTRDTLLTPHPAEAARLLDTDTDRIQSDRIAAAQELAATFACGVVLKGAGSICAFQDGRWHINPTGNPGMASAGMGDVLTGLIGGLLAQGATAANALLAGTYLHGAAADRLVAEGTGPVGLTASELIVSARAILNER